MRRLIDSPWFYFSLAGLLAVAALASQLELGHPQRPPGTAQDLLRLRDRDDLNVVFILVDTLRADRLSAHGYARPTSPNIDALAAHGFLFEEVEAQSSWTKASMASLWTSRYPQATGILRHGDAIPQEATLPAEILKRAGLRTTGIYRNGWVAANFGFDQGFDLYVKPQPNYDPERFKRRTPSTHPLKGSDLDVTQSAREFLQAFHQEPFFLYLHYMDVHQYTYDSDSDLFGTTYSDIYDNSIHWTDANIGALVDTIEALGLIDRTLLVIASDHGEAFREHGLEGHAKNLYREVQRTPLVIVPPFALDGPVVIRSQVANVDIWPTLLDMMGLEPLPHAQGRSLLPLMQAAANGEPEAPVDGFAARAVFSQLDGSWGQPQEPSVPIVAMAESPWRLHWRRPGATTRPELFDHRTDPTEQHDVAAENPDRVDRMSAAVEEYLRSNEPYWEKVEVQLDEMRLNQLRALGYQIGK